MKKLPMQENGEPAARLPSIETAKTFAVETMWHDSPLGFHQVGRWQKKNLKKIEKWCPEYKLATNDLLVDHKRS